MLFFVRFTDRSDRRHVRQAFLGAHLAWLRDHPEVVAAGSLRRDGEDVPVGGAWIVRADTSAAVGELVASDPFWTEGLRESVEILRWSSAFGGTPFPE